MSKKTSEFEIVHCCPRCRGEVIVRANVILTHPAKPPHCDASILDAEYAALRRQLRRDRLAGGQS